MQGSVSNWYRDTAESQRKARRADFVLNVAIWSVLMSVIAGLLLLGGCEPRVPCGVGLMVNSYIHCGPERMK